MIRWGIIGAGQIAHRFVKGLSYSQDGKLYAIASKTKQQEWKDLYPDIVTYDNYDDLLDDEYVDVVYIATWHNAHYEWAKKSLLKGKAVLCEKPATLSSKQTQELVNIAREKKVFFMEAMKTRFVPAVLELQKVLQDGMIGHILKIENRFCYDISGATNTRYLFDANQGGILNDVGSYTIASLLNYIHSPIQDIQNDVTMDKGVDVHDRVTITFESGQIGFLEMAMDEAKSPLMTIIGTKGKITTQPFYRPTEFVVEVDGQKPYTVSKDYIYDDFYTEIEEVHQCLKNHQYESNKMSLQDTIDCIVLTEQIRKISKGA